MNVTELYIAVNRVTTIPVDIFPGLAHKSVMNGPAAIKLIHSLGLTQADTARVVGISATAVQKWRTGGALHGSTETLLLLLKERPEMIGVIKRMKGLE